MDVLGHAQLAALAARLQLNARNGNVANESAPGFAVRPAKGTASRAAAASAYSATAKPASPRIPAAYAKLPVDVDELLPHLSNAKELYSARSAVGKNALQLYGTMVDVLDDDMDMDDSVMEDDMSIIEETEIEREAAVENRDEESTEGDSPDGMQVAGAAFDTRG
jgi:hypothetical protein